MKMAEEFQRCEKCKEGIFEKRIFVLVQKDSPLQWGEPNFHQQETHVICVACNHTQYKYYTQ